MKSNLRSAAPLALALLCALFVHAQDSKNFQPVGGAASASSRQTWRMSRSHTRNDTVRAQAGDQFHIGMGDFEISYRLGLLFGELVYDYRLRWEFGNGTAERGSAALDVGTLQGKPVRVGVPIRYYEKFGIAGSSLPLDADLLARIAKVRPLKFTFVYNVNLKGRIGLANQKEDTTAKPDFDLLKRSRHSSIDQPEAAGVAQSFSVPGSPKWSEMPDYFRDLFKAAKQPDDVVVTDLYPVEIRWPQYELESIIAEQLNRNRKKLASAAAGRADFWDAPVQAAEQPVIVSGDASKDKPAASDKDKAAQELAKRLESARNAPATATDVQLNTLRLEHDAALGNVEYVVLDAAGKELARHGRSASNRSLEIAAVPGTARIELRKDGQKIAAMPWSFSTEKIYKLGDMGPAGGTIFYDKGRRTDGWRYLEVANKYFSRVRLGPITGIPILPITFSEVGRGKENTNSIQSAVATLGSYWSSQFVAVNNVRTHEQNGFKDWFVPSLEELATLRAAIVNGIIKNHNFEAGTYVKNTFWTSTLYPVGYKGQFSKGKAMSFYDGEIMEHIDMHAELNVWPIRQF